jgi:DNA-binding SARP family transcriptional activator
VGWVTNPLTGLTRARTTNYVHASARLVLMGALELESSGAPVALPASARRLLAFVGLRRGPLARVYVAGQLWLDSTETRAGACLRSALWRLNRVAGDVVWSDGRELGLTDRVEVDCDAVAAAAQEVLSTAGPVRAELVALLCESDDLLPDWYDDWAEVERERFRQIRLHALERLCERLTAEGRFAEALEAGLAAVGAEPLRESAHRAMISMHLAEGNVGEAVRQYATCTRLMSTELGVRPSGQIERLVAEGLALRKARRGRPERRRRCA